MAWCNISEVFVFIAGIVGNCAACSAIVRTWSNRTSLNMYLIFIVITDLVNCLWLPVIYISYIMYDEWVFGMTICYIHVYAEMILLYFNMFLILSAFVTFSFMGPSSPRTTRITITLLFLLAVLVTAPRDLVHEEHCFQDVGFHCITLLLKVLTPMFLVCLLFVLRASQKKRELHFLSEMKVHRLTLAIMICYIVSFFPITYSTVIMELSQEHYYDVFAQLFTTTQLAVKPFLFYWLDETLRNEFDRMMKRRYTESASRSLLGCQDDVLS